MLSFFFALTLFLARAALVRRSEGRPALLLAAGTGAAAAGAFLSKGLIGIVLPGAILLCVVSRHAPHEALFRPGPLSVLPVFLALCLPWLFAAEARVPGFSSSSSSMSISSASPRRKPAVPARLLLSRHLRRGVPAGSALPRGGIPGARADLPLERRASRRALLCPVVCRRLRFLQRVAVEAAALPAPGFPGGGCPGGARSHRGERTPAVDPLRSLRIASRSRWRCCRRRANRSTPSACCRSFCRREFSCCSARGRPCLCRAAGPGRRRCRSAAGWAAFFAAVALRWPKGPACDGRVHLRARPRGSQRLRSARRCVPHLPERLFVGAQDAHTRRRLHGRARAGVRAARRGARRSLLEERPFLEPVGERPAARRPGPPAREGPVSPTPSPLRGFSPRNGSTSSSRTSPNPSRCGPAFIRLTKTAGRVLPPSTPPVGPGRVRFLAAKPLLPARQGSEGAPLGGTNPPPPFWAGKRTKGRRKLPPPPGRSPRGGGGGAPSRRKKAWGATGCNRGRCGR